MKKARFSFIHEWYLFIRGTGFFSPSVSRFIACQFALESNFGTSCLAKYKNNYCGMKVPQRRCFYGFRIESSPYAGYISISDCIRDYISWIFYQRPLPHNLFDLESFKLFLRDSGYCPEDDYISRITNIYNQFIKDEQSK